MDAGTFTVKEAKVRDWLSSAGHDSLFAGPLVEWRPLETGAESEVVKLVLSAQQCRCLIGPGRLAMHDCATAGDDSFYVSVELGLPDGSSLRLASPPRPWETLVEEEKTGLQAAVDVLDAVTAEANTMLRTLERFITPAEHAAFDQAVAQFLDVVDGIQEQDVCQCGDLIALVGHTWFHIYNERLRGTDDHDPAP
jgi:hypothetical protein